MRLSWLANAGFRRRDGGVGSGRSRYSQTVAATFGSSASGSRSIAFFSGAVFTGRTSGGTFGRSKRAGTTLAAPGWLFADAATPGLLSWEWTRALNAARTPATLVFDDVFGVVSPADGVSG